MKKVNLVKKLYKYMEKLENETKHTGDSPAFKRGIIYACENIKEKLKELHPTFNEEMEQKKIDVEIIKEIDSKVESGEIKFVADEKRLKELCKEEDKK